MAELKDDQLTMEEFRKMLEKYPVVRNADYAPEDIYPSNTAAAITTSNPPLASAVDADQTSLLEQTLREFTLDERKISTEGKDFFAEFSALVLRYMTPEDAERFVQAFREEHEAFVASLTLIEARKMREDLAKKT